MVTTGVAVGFGQVVQLNPVVGLQVKLFPLLTCNVVESPMQIVGDAALIVGVEPDVVKYAMMLSVVVKFMETAESVVLGTGVWF